MLTSEQIRAARAMLRIEQKDLATRAGVSLETVKRIERAPGIVSAYTSTLNLLQRALEAAGIEFTNGDQPGVRLVKPVETAPAEPAHAAKPAAGPKRRSQAGKRASGVPKRGPA
jgi:transcriptional regulator with XRE-family HTH domain